MNHDCRDGSWSKSASGAKGPEPSELGTGKGISDTVLCTRKVLQQHGEIVTGCCVKQGADKGHEWFASRGTGAPYIDNRVVVAVNEEAFAGPAAPHVTAATRMA